jgi:ankyrin repeat protein
MDVREFPPRPDLEHYRKQAKDLLKAYDRGDADAVARVRAVTGPGESVKLADAQLTLAREHGFASWPKFKVHVAGLLADSGGISSFERAVDAVVDGDEAALRILLDRDSSLVTARSSRDHRATLLHYISANGVEDFRQRSPRNARAIAELLLDRGAVVDAVSHSYGDDDTTMGLLVSSVHPHLAGVQVDLVHTLIDHGAAVDGIANDGGNVLTALAFQYPLAADALVQRGARIDNILSAAGIGRLDLVRQYADTPPTGLPAWVRRDGLPPRAKALLWAAALGRLDVVDFLSLDRELLSAVDNQGFTALHWAAFNGHDDVVSLLISRGSDLEARTIYGGSVLGSTVWAVANAENGVDRVPVLRTLLAAGAKLDGQATPTGNADVDSLLAG